MIAWRYFNPRSPYVERPPRHAVFQYYPVISIHALRKESDMETPRNSDNYDISIHALRKESDRHHRQAR